MDAFLPPFCYSKRDLKQVNGIVYHWISLKYADPDNMFDMSSIQLFLTDLNLEPHQRQKYMLDYPKRAYGSYHYLIGRNGELWNLVPEGKIAYHAGKSSLYGLDNWNNFSRGVAFVGTNQSKFEYAQYETSAKLNARIIKEHAIKDKMRVGHEQVAPGRKQDPGIATGNFDVDLHNQLINQYF